MPRPTTPEARGRWANRRLLEWPADPRAHPLLQDVRIVEFCFWLTSASHLPELGLGDLAGWRHREAVDAADRQRGRVIARLRRDRGRERFRVDIAAIRGDERNRPLAQLGIRHRDHRGLLDAGLTAQRLLDIARIPGRARDLDQLGEASTHGDVAVAV